MRTRLGLLATPFKVGLVAHATMDEKGESHKLTSSTSSRRLAVLQGHLKSSSPVAYGVRTNPCGGGSKATVQSSAPMSSSKDEVQKAFPRQR